MEPMYSQTKDSYYAKHLSEFNDNGRSSNVFLSEDVYNTDGKLVASKKLQVTQRVAQIIAKHNLVKPIENSIWIKDGLNEGALIQACSKKIDSLCFSAPAFRNRLLEDVKSACYSLCHYPLILQKLTVLSKQLPSIYEKTLLCSLLSLGLSKELSLNKDTKDNIFIANIVSDIGLLHLSPTLVLKEGVYSVEEWQMMQGHIAIAKHFADRVPQLPKSVARAALEHHERADGFGDPFGKTLEKLGIEGQILSMSDTLGKLHSQHVMSGQHSWNAVYDVILVPTSAHSESIRKAALRFLKQFELPWKAKYSADEYSTVVEELQSKHKCLNEWFEVITQILDLHNAELQEQNDFKPYTLLNELNRAIVTSGLLNRMQLDWLENIPQPISEKDGFDIEEYELKLSEVENQCFFVMRKLRMLNEEMAKRFNSDELAKHYYSELMDILRHP
jgi:HD-GYP domain-containing protein (c-di-GMP phosphodiesterase class II)